MEEDYVASILDVLFIGEFYLLFFKEFLIKKVSYLCKNKFKKYEKEEKNVIKVYIFSNKLNA